MRHLRQLLLATCLGLLPGCGVGLIYTHVVVPLDLNQDVTPELELAGKSDMRTFQYFVRFDWNSAAIADAARAAGITHIYYADMEILSVWFGVWEQRTAIVYGTGPGMGGAAPPSMPGPDG